MSLSAVSSSTPRSAPFCGPITTNGWEDPDVMSPAEVLDYALGQLEADRRERFDRWLASDPALNGRVAGLIRNLDRLLDDGAVRGASEALCSPPCAAGPPVRGAAGRDRGAW